MTYSWGDSITRGIMEVFAPRKDINLYIEHLDTKRFGNKLFEEYYTLFNHKYNNTGVDLVITSDNNAFDFVRQYPDLFPGKPIVFCGINNPEDYELENTTYYGVKEGVDLDAVFKLIIKVMPDVSTLYFLNDSTATSLVNLQYAKELEPKYSGVLEFKYITGLSLASTYEKVKQIEPGSAIALVNLFQESDKTPVNSDLTLDTVAAISPVPVFMDAMPSFGKGIAGGIINSGVSHGRQTAELALRFIDNPDFKPETRVQSSRDNYYFDYAVLQKYNIDPKRIPEGSIVINKPNDKLIKYLMYIFALLGFIALEGVIIWLLIRNVNQRRKAQAEVIEKYKLIQLQNEELEIAKNKAIESEQLKTAFLANISHEIRTPLNAIVGFSDLFKDETVTDDEKARFSDIIETNSKHLLGLISDILDLSKSEAGVLKVHYEACNVNDLLEDVISTHQHLILGKPLKLELSNKITDPAFTIYSDPLRLKQILSNFLTNAIKFTSRGYVKLGCYLSRENIVFYVADTGIGMDEKTKEKVFDRFWKIETFFDDFNPGTGLGLTISKILAEALKGKIFVESKENQGATFFFEHPLHKVAPADSDPSIENIK